MEYFFFFYFYSYFTYYILYLPVITHQRFVILYLFGCLLISCMFFPSYFKVHKARNDFHFAPHCLALQLMFSNYLLTVFQLPIFHYLLKYKLHTEKCTSHNCNLKKLSHHKCTHVNRYRMLGTQQKILCSLVIITTASNK